MRGRSPLDVEGTTITVSAGARARLTINIATNDHQAAREVLTQGRRRPSCPRAAGGRLQRRPARGEVPYACRRAWRHRSDLTRTPYPDRLSRANRAFARGAVRDMPGLECAQPLRSSIPTSASTSKPSARPLVRGGRPSWWQSPLLLVRNAGAPAPMDSRRCSGTAGRMEGGRLTAREGEDGVSGRTNDGARPRPRTVRAKCTVTPSRRSCPPISRRRARFLRHAPGGGPPLVVHAAPPRERRGAARGPRSANRPAPRRARERDGGRAPPAAAARRSRRCVSHGFALRGHGVSGRGRRVRADREPPSKLGSGCSGYLKSPAASSAPSGLRLVRDRPRPSCTSPSFGVVPQCSS